ncbi:MAG: hypothetical protein ABSA34_05030 [Candidatus Goldiibacteriota bacterium]|jgi:hypothetical protein
MLKKLTLAFIAMILIFAAGCKGSRSVKVVYTYNDLWSGSYTANNTTVTTGADRSMTYDLGDYTSKVVVDAVMNTVACWAGQPVPGIPYDGVAYQQCTPNISMPITIEIDEDFDNGFLYLASTNVKATASESRYCYPVEISYDFSAK